MLLDENKQKLLHQQLNQTHDFYLLLSANFESDGVNQTVFSNASMPVILLMLAKFIIHYSNDQHTNYNSILHNIASTCDMLQEKNF